MNFGEWLQEQIQKQGLTYEELAYKSGISKSYISVVVSGQRKVTRNFCVAVAKGLGLDEIYVLSKAGLISAVDTLDLRTREIMETVKPLSDDKKKIILKFARFLSKEPD